MPTVKCQICNKSFYAKPRHLKIGWGKYCSIKCRSVSQFKGKHYKCEYCGKTIYRNPSDIKKSTSGKLFCSRSCQCSWMNSNKRVLENSANWNGGESIYRNILKQSRIIQKCNRCGIENKKLLVVHHKNRNRKDNSIKNLEWLCRNCHYLEHFD